MTFKELNLSAPLLRAVQEAGYETPSPIQAAAIPPVLAGRDLMGCAQTGTGKTAACALPLLARLEEKGCVTREKQGRGYLYTAALTRAAYLSAESRSLWGRLFGGSPRNFVAALAETDTLTDADIDELAEYLEELKKERK